MYCAGMEVVVDTSHRPRRGRITDLSLEDQLSQVIRSRSGGVPEVRLLVEQGADISRQCDPTWTPLTLAAYLGKNDVVAYLLQCITQASAQPSHSQSQEHPRLDEGNDGVDIFPVIHAESAQSTTQPPPRYRRRPTVEDVNDNGHTALYCAAQRGHADVCLTLLEGGADVNAQSVLGKDTALLAAVEAGHSQVVTLLLERGADTQLTDNVGISPLYKAVVRDSVDLTRQLVKAGCDVNVGSQDHSPIFLAARKGFLDVMKLLCESGCYQDIANKYGVTALYEAALKGHSHIVEYLLERGCDVNKFDIYGNSPLHAAVLMGHLDPVKMLINAGACVKWRNSQGRCPVQLALQSGLSTILHYFLLQGFDITKKPNLAFTDQGGQSVLLSFFEHSERHPETALLVLRGCSNLDLRPLRNLGSFGTEPALLEMLLCSGLSHPPRSLLQAPDIHSRLSPDCQDLLTQHRLNPPSLKSLSRACVRASLGNTIFHSAPKLPLPEIMLNYLLFSSSVHQK